jgi:hypothetical protein
MEPAREIFSRSMQKLAIKSKNKRPVSTGYVSKDSSLE